MNPTQQLIRLLPQFLQLPLGLMYLPPPEPAEDAVALRQGRDLYVDLIEFFHHGSVEPTEFLPEQRRLTCQWPADASFNRFQETLERWMSELILNPTQTQGRRREEVYQRVQVKPPIRDLSIPQVYSANLVIRLYAERKISTVLLYKLSPIEVRPGQAVFQYMRAVSFEHDLKDSSC